jgi:hypothetical protein
LDGGSEDAAAMTSDPDGMATTEPGIRSYLDGEVSLELAIPHERVSPRVGAPMPRETGELNLIACSRCLRVLRDGKTGATFRVHVPCMRGGHLRSVAGAPDPHSPSDESSERSEHLIVPSQAAHRDIT